MTLTTLIGHYFQKKERGFKVSPEIIANPEITDKKVDEIYNFNEDGKFSNLHPESNRPINVNGDWVTELAYFYFFLPIADRFDRGTYAQYLLDPRGAGHYGLSNRTSAETAILESDLRVFYREIFQQLGGDGVQARSCRVYVDACRYQRAYEESLAKIGLMPRDGFRWIRD